jgi:2-C-methyl-D-erythritol 4-phosphate cytidylyltransferase
VVVAAGRGERLGAPAKVLLPLAGRPLLAYALAAAQDAASIREVVVVAGEHTRQAIEALVGDGPWPKVRSVVVGGERRQDSVAAGVAALPPEIELVAVHDAARPLVEPALFDRCLDAARRTGAAVAAVPVADTLKRVVDGRVVGTVSRDGLWAAQTPQAFRRALLVAALERGRRAGGTATDEAGLCEGLGIEVAIVAGDPTNLKITHAADLALAEAVLAQRRAATVGGAR